MEEDKSSDDTVPIGDYVIVMFLSVINSKY